jgi:hypothetical protein
MQSPHDGVDGVALSFKQGVTELTDADRAKYFDTIPNERISSAYMAPLFPVASLCGGENRDSMVEYCSKD